MYIIFISKQFEDIVISVVHIKPPSDSFGFIHLLSCVCVFFSSDSGTRNVPQFPIALSP